MPIHKFSESLAIGCDGETTFQKAFPLKLLRLCGKHADFAIDESYDLLELKSPGYPLTTMFIESRSNRETGTLGGPIRSESLGIKWFVYWREHECEWAIYNCATLAMLMRSVMADSNGRKVVSVKNYNREGGFYHSEGFIFTRRELVSFEYKLDSKLRLVSPECGI